jgi:hypothetical protein
VGSTAGGVGFLRTAVLSWKVGGGSAGGQSPTCECCGLIISEIVYWIICEHPSRDRVTKIVFTHGLVLLRMALFIRWYSSCGQRFPGSVGW